MEPQAKIVDTGQDSLGFFDRFIGIISSGADAAQKVRDVVEGDKYRENLADAQANPNTATASDASVDRGLKDKFNASLTPENLMMVGVGLVAVVGLFYVLKKI